MVNQVKSRNSDEYKQEYNKKARERYQNDLLFKTNRIKTTKKSYGRPGEREKRLAYRRNKRQENLFQSLRIELVYRVKKYGITIEQYDSMWSAQNYSCAVCRTKEDNVRNPWPIDHCHITGKVRGILCYHCNLLLGHAKDNTDILESAIRYLNEQKKEQENT